MTADERQNNIAGEGNVRWQPSKRFSLLFSVAGLLIFFALALEAGIAKAPTADEGMHLLRGQVLRQSDELGLQGQHTPLSHWLIGTFFFIEPTLPDVQSLQSWAILEPELLVREFLWQSGADVTRILLLGRLPIIFVGMLIGAMLAHWARLRTGAFGLIIAVTLFAFSPNLLASTALATTDLVATATFLAALLALWHFWQQPSFWRWLLAALTLGLAISAKLTGLVILPITLLLSYLEMRDRPWWRPGLVWVSMLPIAGLVLWAAYGFEIGRVTGLPIPVPAATFVNNFVEVQQHIDRGHFAYLLGERSNEGWWHYFGVAFLIKTPAITLLLLLVALIYLSLRRRWRQTVYFWLPAVVLFVVASYSRLNIGFRHILSIAPLIWLLIAETTPFWRQRYWLMSILFLALIIYAVSGFRQRPNFISYFNEFVGGPAQGYRYLGDSNVDWGQDLKLLANYAQSVDGDRLYVSYFGPSDPAYYGLDEPPLFDENGNPVGFAPANPAAGHYAISVNHLQGTTEIEPDLFDWFRRSEPVGNLGHSILLFDVPDQLDGKWIGHCLDPLPLLDEESAVQFVGSEKVRHVYFDCRSTWVIPAGDEAGWYILPQDLNPNSISPDLSENLSLMYSNSPDYDIYFWPGPDGVIERIIERAGLTTSADGQPVTPPLAVEGIARFLGGLVSDSTWGSIWQAVGLTERPVSVLLHLNAPDQPPSIADGLGYQGVQWHPGDIIIQYHNFYDFPGQFLETGLYDYVTGERLPLGEAGDTVRIYGPSRQ
jgi:hypothetical protein